MLRLAHSLAQLRERLAHADAALLPLTLLGAASGLLTGLVVVGFRGLTEDMPAAVGWMPHGEAFEALPWEVRLTLPIVGGLLIGLGLRFLAVGARQVGVGHVMQRLAYHSGRLPWQNAAVQFVLGSASILSGHSVGREGPVIHVGAASASLLGQSLGLPNNSLRVLVACGTAAGIAASFNTPLAGVIFAMEVVLMEYTMAGFAPVIIAAVFATSLSHFFYGDAAVFDILSITLASQAELAVVVALGIVIGALAAALSASVRKVDERTQAWPLPLRTTLAGIVTGVCALFAPQIMGVGYDTVQLALVGGLGLGVLALIVAAKFLATTACIGLGIPGGLIGPTLVIGATAGAAFGAVGQALGIVESPIGLYALLGMGAMMGGALQAPLAALVAAIELTGLSETVMAEMLAIVVATITARVVFGQQGAFIALLRARGVDYQVDPVSISLSRTGVGAVMSRRTEVVDARLSLDTAKAVLARAPQWLLVRDGERIRHVLSLRTLETAVDEAQEAAEVHLAVDLEQPNFTTVRVHATLRDAVDELRRAGTRFVLVTDTTLARTAGTRGLLTEDMILSGVRYQPRGEGTPS